MFVDLPLRLNYVLPDGEVVLISKVEVSDDEWFLSYLHTMVEMNPDTIFFFTVATTDVFELDQD